MKKRVWAGRGLVVSRVAVVAVLGGAVSACSSDTMRFNEAFNNPFGTSERFASAQPAAQPQGAAMTVASLPTPSVQSQALPPIQSQPLAPIQTGSVSRPSPAPSSAPVTASGPGGWTAAGGTRITVAANDSLNAISQRYGVPTNALLQANGLSSPSQVTAGSQIVIPVYHAGAASSQIAAAPAAQPRQRAESPRLAATTSARPAEATEAPRQRVRPGLAAPQSAPAQTAARTPVPQAPPMPVVAQAAAPVAPPPQLTARAEAPKTTAPAYAPQPAQATAVQQEVAKAPAAEPEQTGAIATDFRWPARGRIIAGFGANGGNEGINIAVPEGTPVKAAEAGTVTYAGDEVKGYGNLILVRHDNGYVSAYAHNSALQVKRGERVKRGQVIATSGQTGNVTSPQLHFEIRKGQTAVDPTKYLSGA
ncbi:MAG TPA: peptidoglycan DD-metalloendopeptidase family protein [Microvirga sp.]|jgi:murein DD-endopeptidase MepM/ murein hydrolase activator NlpD|nr:peptidoglycan DD-metalloendopeptidase family protein [Microvirga sp.]